MSAKTDDDDCDEPTNDLVSVGGTILGLLNPVTLVIGAIAGLITYMGWWDETFALVRESIEFLANIVSILGQGLLWLGNKAIQVFTPLDSLGDAARTIGEAFDWAATQIPKAGKMADKWLGPLDEAAGKALRNLDQEAEARGGVSLGPDREGGSKGGSSSPTAGASASPAIPDKFKGGSRSTAASGGQQGYAGQSSETTYNGGDVVIQNVDAGSDADEATIERAARRGAEKALWEREMRNSPRNA